MLVYLPTPFSEHINMLCILDESVVNLEPHSVFIIVLLVLLPWTLGIYYFCT
jgi:hypothetical protein